MNLDNLTKGQKLYFLGVNGIELCEVYIPRILRSIPIRYGPDEPDVFHGAASVVVLLPNNRTKILTGADRDIYFPSEQQCLAHFKHLQDKLKTHTGNENE